MKNNNDMEYNVTQNIESHIFNVYNVASC